MTFSPYLNEVVEFGHVVEPSTGFYVGFFVIDLRGYYLLLLCAR